MSKIILTSAATYVGARKLLGDHRKVFDSVADALSTLKAIYALPEFPAEFPVLGSGIGLIDVTGDDSIPPLTEWPAEFSIPDVKVCVTFIGIRGEKDSNGKTSNGARGFFVYPLHSISSISAAESGDDWLWKIIEKEASHVALRGIRNVAPALGVSAMEQAAKSAPLSVTDYVESSVSEGIDTDAFDAIWKQFRKLLAETPSTAALVTEMPSKAEVIKALRSKAFAAENYERLESMGAFIFIGETMGNIIDHMKGQAVEKGQDFDYDSSEIRTWLTKRNEFVFAAPKKSVADLSTVDFSAFMGTLASQGLGKVEETEQAPGETSTESTPTGQVIDPAVNGPSA